MSRTSFLQNDKFPLVVVAFVLAIIVACFPLARSFDEATDRQRPMFDDLRSMEWLQYQQYRSTGRAVPLELAGGESTELAGKKFVASDGVKVVVRASDADVYCVQVSNQYGDVSTEHCLDKARPPVDPARSGTADVL